MKVEESSASSGGTPRGPLHGVRVLDLTTVVMGPFATVTLADLGADVIKIEPPAGDMSRFIGASRSTGMSGLTINLQRNKRSIVLDLALDHDRAILDGLVRTSDVLVTNLRPKSRARLGVTWERLSAANPALIMCVAQAYAADSDRADMPAYDDVVQASSGLASLSEKVDGVPRYAPFVAADKVTGLYMVTAVLAALFHKSRTGEGQFIDVPMVDSLIAFNLVEHLSGITFSPPEGPFGWARILVPERIPHRTADGWICIMPYSNRDWERFFDVFGAPEYGQDPRFATVDSRHKNMGELLRFMQERVRTRTTAEWLDECARAGIPASEMMDLAEVTSDPYARARGLVTLTEHPTEGAYFATSTPFRMSRTPASTLRRHAPHLGEHTREVLAELEAGGPETVPEVLDA